MVMILLLMIWRSVAAIVVDANSCQVCGIGVMSLLLIWRRPGECDKDAVVVLMLTCMPSLPGVGSF